MAAKGPDVFLYLYFLQPQHAADDEVSAHL
jgi:hypothetical protein